MENTFAVTYNKEQGKGCTLVLLDLSAAFDTVDHAVLFNLLEHPLGISGNALSLGLILRHHCINYHIYADYTQLYISFDLSDPIIAIDKVNKCISDLYI